MSVWTEQVDTSLIVERLNELGPAIDQALGWKGIDAAAIEGLERIRTVLTFIGKRVDGLEGALLRPGSLAPIAGNILATTQNVQAFATDGAPAHLEQAHAQIDGALSAFAGLVLPAKTSDLRGLREASEAYRETLSGALVRVQAEVQEKQRLLDAFGSLLAKSKAAFEETEGALKSEIEAFRSKIIEAQGVLTVAYQGAEQKLGEGVAAKLTEWQAAFDTAEKARATESTAGLEGQEADFTALVEKHEGILKSTDSAWDQKLADADKNHIAAHTALQKDYADRAASIVAKIEENLTEASELVAVIGDRAVTSGHKKAADDALKEVTFWHRVTLFAMSTLILFAGATALDFVTTNFDWLGFARRVYFSIAVGVLAAYGASQANRYQQIERRNRKLELELKALEPFLKQVSAEQREPFRLKMAEAFFGRDEVGGDKPGPATAADVAKETVDKGLDLLKTIADKLPGRG